MSAVCVYPGTFDPPTLGHIDVAERAAKLFDEVMVAVGANMAKTPLLSTEERIGALRACLGHISNVKITSFDGLLVEFATEVGARAIVRGLRANADFEHEFQMALVNRRLQPNLETVLLITNWDYTYLSSSIVREVAVLGGRFERMVPEGVIPYVEAALRRRNSHAE
jgi:pantetheine-phosphate adenylyltransferase